MRNIIPKSIILTVFKVNYSFQTYNIIIEGNFCEKKSK